MQTPPSLGPTIQCFSCSAVFVEFRPFHIFGTKPVWLNQQNVLVSADLPRFLPPSHLVSQCVFSQRRWRSRSCWVITASRFRPCQRCRPSESCPPASWATSTSSWVKSALYLVARVCEALSVVTHVLHRKLQKAEFKREALQTHRSSGNIQILRDQKTPLCICASGMRSLWC